MRKKYLSALLFGALLFASAGTFTSCKDYDDDINGLRTEITDLKSAIDELQTAVDNGKYVTAVSNSGNTITFTFSDGSTTPITVEDEKGSVVTVNEDGVLCIDGDPTEIKVATADPEGEATKSQIIIGEDNCWQVLQEDGTYKTTNVPVSGVNVSGSEAEGYTLTIFDETGTPTTVKLPSAASAISEIILAGDDQAAIELSLSSTEFTLQSATITGFNAASFRSNWKGAKTLPADGSYIIRPAENYLDAIKMRVNPVDVDASIVNFKLTNSLNQDLEGITLKANPENNTPAAGTPDGRAAAKGGLYTMEVEDLILANGGAWNNYKNAFKVATDDVNFALNPNATVRSAYRIQVSEGTPYSALDEISIKDYPTTPTSSVNDGVVAVPVTLDKGATYTILPDVDNALYDIMISADQEAINNYGLTFDPATQSFTIGRDIDTSTTGTFTLNVTTVDVLGNAKNFTYTVTLSDKVVDATEYTTIKHAVETSDDVFGIDLSIMKQGMNAEELNTWKTRVDFTATAYAIYPSLNDAKDKSNQIVTAGISSGAVLSSALVTENIDKYATTNVSAKDKANYISVKVDDSQAATSGLTLFTTYYIRVDFNSSSTATTPLNTIIVPVEFTAPTVSELYKAKPGLEKDGVVYGFMSGKQNFTIGGSSVARPAYAIESAFEKVDVTATYTVEGDLIDGLNNVKSSDRFVVAGTGSTANVGFIDDVPGKDRTQDAYAKAFTLKAYSADYKDTWVYPADGQYTDYKFKMTLMSPIYDGSFADGTTLTVNGGQDFTFTNDQLKFYDYNNTPVKILQDAWDDTATPAGAWSDTRIADVTPDDDNEMLDNEGKLDIIDADWDATANKVIEGYITGKAASVAVDGTENLHVIIKDNMGYERTFKIPVTIKANK